MKPTVEKVVLGKVDVRVTSVADIKAFAEENGLGYDNDKSKQENLNSMAALLGGEIVEAVDTPCVVLVPDPVIAPPKNEVIIGFLERRAHMIAADKARDGQVGGGFDPSNIGPDSPGFMRRRAMKGGE